MVDSIKTVLMQRGMSEEDAESLIEEAKGALAIYLEESQLSYAEEICAEYFGLEPDYLEELMEGLI